MCENEPDQRRSLFCTRYKCEHKFCDVIIDGGSTDNLVSREDGHEVEAKEVETPMPIVFCLSTR